MASKYRTHKYWLNKFKSIYGDKYLYPDFDKNKLKKGHLSIIEIECSKHGRFKKKIQSHVNYVGCPKCVKESKQEIPKELIPICQRVRSLVTGNLKRKGFSKNSKTAEILGCTWLELQEHLENNKYGFKLGDENVDIDHIIPISEANTEQEIYELSNYKNLQLLPSYYNRYVKKDTRFDVNCFEKWCADNRFFE